MDKPLVLVTNNDGIASRGLWAAVEAVMPFGEVLVVAPDRQWSGGGRSVPPYVTCALQSVPREINGVQIAAYAVDASPALTVVHGVLELAPRLPALVVSGINFGANLGTEVTISGTVGAALEAGAFGIPSLAVSLEMDPAYHLTGDDSADYAAAMAFTRRFAEHLLAYPMPADVDALNVNIPSDATAFAEWRFTRLSRRRYFLPTAPERAWGKGRPGYEVNARWNEAEPDSDMRAMGERVVSVTPLSMDLTSRVSFPLETSLSADPGLRLSLPRPIQILKV